MPLSKDSEEYQLFDRCNHTELYQIARNAGHVVLPNYDRDTLIQIILEAVPKLNVVNEFDAWRRALIEFLVDHRRVLETQIACPARCLYEPPYADQSLETKLSNIERDRSACFGCVDAQVINCLTSNGDNSFRLIQLRKKTA